MNTTPLTDVYDHWTRCGYPVRVRGTTDPTLMTFLWGSAGITKNIPIDKPLILHIHNDTFGENIVFGTRASGSDTDLGTLKPGECVSIQVQAIQGVYANCVDANGQPVPNLESTVSCSITAAD